MNQKQFILILFFFVSFYQTAMGAGFTINSCDVSSLTNDGSPANSCFYGDAKKGKISGVGNGDLNGGTLDTINGGGWALPPALKSDITDALTITGAGGTIGEWEIKDFNVTDFFTPTVIDTDFSMDALFVIKTSTAFEWFVFNPFSATLSGSPVVLNAAGGWNTYDFVQLKDGKVIENKYPEISHLSVYFRESEISPVPLPGAIWLFGSALLAMFGFNRKINV